MGGRRSSSSSATTVSTTTTTNIRDIGLTGQNVVDAVAVLEAGAVERQRIGERSLNALIDFGNDLSARNAALTQAAAESTGARQAALTGQIIQASEALPGESDLVKIAPFIAAAAVIILPVVLRR